MKKIIAFLITACAIAACSKDKFKTVPQVSIDSYNTKVVGTDQTLNINVKFTDKEGDLSNGKFVYIQQRTNLRPPPPNTGYPDSVINTIPTFPDNTQGDFQVSLPWRFLHLSDLENDTLVFRFVVVDRAGNKSDTLNSDQIVILRQ